MVPDVPNWFFSATSFIGFVLCMIPLPWHIEAWNTGTCLYMVWAGLACLNLFINSVVWNSDVIDKAPVWCDISTQIMIASAVALPAASLCINRRLYQIASVQSVTKSRAQKRRDIMIDLAIGLGLPVLQMALHTVVQSHRYVIIEEAGCFPFTLNTPASYPLVWAWPVAIGLVSASYCICTIRELAIRRAQFKEFLSANRSLSSSRYFRLMGLAGVEMLFTVPLGCWSIYINLTTSTVEPYVNWDSAHANFGTIEQVPSVVWKQDSLSVASIETSRYGAVFCALLFFVFFGFADEARKNYRLAYTSVAKRVGLSTESFSATGTWSANSGPHRIFFSQTDPIRIHPATVDLPICLIFITQQTEKKRDSLTSFSSRMSLPDYGGALEDVKKEPFSPTTTSAGSISRESLPRLPVDMGNVSMPALPEATPDTRMPPRYAPDAPHAI
ncbi:STE3-domain-containing protein [Chiua virens]|nr:STE3-domain-containing protein [Chiua virens]